MTRCAVSIAWGANDPSLHLAGNFAVMHNAHSETMW